MGRGHDDRGYVPLERYGLIGDGHTAALVADDGSIDWLCAPRFDSPAVFWRLLDTRRGGYFQIEPTEPYSSEQSYEPLSNVLRTAFRTSGGALVVRDAMAVRLQEDGRFAADRRLLRLVECTEGRVELAVRFAPRPGFRAEPPNLIAEGTRVVARARDWSGALHGTVPLVVEGRLEAVRAYSLAAGERCAFALDYATDRRVFGTELDQIAHALEETGEAWRRWASACRYDGPYRDAVLRSALVLRLLFHEPTGALVAAPTTSLPEAIGGERNWDYRYAWLRDAAFALDALFALGYREEGRRFFEWITRTVKQCPSAADLGVVYTLDGRPLPQETVLDKLEGYEGSRPVRVGNAASRQLQLDVYGELVQCLYGCHLMEGIDAAPAWFWFKGIIDCVAANWRLPDYGIWEVRCEPRHFVYSKVMAWTAVERGARLAERLDPRADVSAWRAAAEAIRCELLARGYDRELGAFVRAYGEKALDASNLLLPATGFIAPHDPRMQNTITRTVEELGAGDLLYRYQGEDGLEGEEGAFLPCAFWLVDALALSGRLEEAQERFERFLHLATPLGLFAEEMDPETKRHLGNFPQALTHLALIQSALRLATARGEGAPAKG